MLISFALAVQFLTRIPIHIKGNISNQHLGQSVLFYPIIGIAIGITLVLIAQLLPNTHPALTAAIILSIWVALTGGLHLDGLADCSDAWAGGLGDKERSLSIMKDPAAGPIAVVILVLLLLLKWSALQTLLQQDHILMPLVLAPFLGRLSILMLMLTTPYIRKNGLGAAMQTELPKHAAKLIVIFSLASSFWLGNVTMIISACLAIALLRYLAMQRLQGVTGDVYGASVEITETVVLTSLILSQ
ncbi:MAG: adenosylcobinamide-GDP ribazoletransferase [Methyloprofundus sp.]|nr:MAG: adenosylcobinamide-GDP ribazoletransferase [Methyloprofundus sp.]